MGWLRNFWWLAVVAFGASGCSPGDPLDRVVAAESPAAFAMWKSRSTGRLPAQQSRDLDEAIQELKLAIMAGREATGSAEIEAAMRAKIDRHTIREVLRLGFESKVRRLELERKGLLIATEQNSRLITRPGDTKSSVHLEQFREKQAARLAAADSELRSAREKLEALAKPAGAPKN